MLWIYQICGCRLEHGGTAAPESRDYEYDAVNRLVTELMTDGSRSFEYDEVGNRLLKTAVEGEQTSQTEDYSYSAASNRLQAVDAENYQYDANGNLLARGNQSWTYNARNRMAAYSENGTQQAAYTYNAQGERVKKTLADGTVVHFQYNGMGQLMAEYRYSGGSQVEARQYVWLGMMPVAVVVADGDSNKSVYYLHSDHLATARLATDGQQNVVWQWASSAFGEELPVENGLSLNLRFPGQYYDVESGLNYNYFRDYDAGIGRYVQSDPIGLDAGPNTYAYVNGSPLNYFDPFGLRELTENEKAFVEAFFGDCVDADKHQINPRVWGDTSRAFSPTKNRSHVPDPFFVDDDPSKELDFSNQYGLSVFAHEVMHTWQREIKRQVFFPGLLAQMFSEDPYNYDKSVSDPSKVYEQFQNATVEQQGKMVQDFVYDSLMNRNVDKWDGVANALKKCDKSCK